jgi:hypothetical protein
VPVSRDAQPIFSSLTSSKETATEMDVMAITAKFAAARNPEQIIANVLTNQ